jgi:hypothetical protein
LNRNTSDIFRLIRLLSPARVWNAAKLTGSFYASRLAGKPFLWGSPWRCRWSPPPPVTSAAPNAQRIACFYTSTGMLDKNFFQTVIDQVHHHVTWLTFYFQGEPFLTGFFRYGKICRKQKKSMPPPLQMPLLDDDTAKKVVESGMQRLIISIDGLTQETYEQYRVGGRLEKYWKEPATW